MHFFQLLNEMQISRKKNSPIGKHNCLNLLKKAAENRSAKKGELAPPQPKLARVSARLLARVQNKAHWDS